ncbi:DUF3180 family protein [Jatrophihabitans sp.]|uniref:DUF3180 family protein n=1 Tax=Jatrophihabitans sp. TaxID=1932789 RepID=UPI0030C68961|nr:hypothetical protein [Jatrophihabitans sp.]
MRRTGLLDLLVPFLTVGLASYLVLRVSYESIPPLGYAVPVPLAALAVAELVAARRVRAAVRHIPGATPMAAIVIARCVALGKASAVVGAAVAGAAGGLLFRVLPDAGTVRAAAHDARVGALLLAASLLTAVAGLLLERAGLDPNRDRDEPQADR